MRFLTRELATEFLRGQGVPLADGALRDMAHRQQGPRFAVINRRALYRPEDLLAWLDEAAKPRQSRIPRAA